MKAEKRQHIVPDETTRQWFRYAALRWTLSCFITMLVWAVGIPGMGAAPALIFLLSFSLLRKYAGGFHASSVPRCLGCSLFQIVLCAYILYPAMAKSLALFALTLAGSATGVTVWLAPVLPAQLHADQAVMQACRRRACGIVVAEFFVVALLLLMRSYRLALGGSLGMEAAAISLLIENDLRKRRM